MNQFSDARSYVEDSQLEARLVEAADQFSEDLNSGKKPSIEDYASQYPEIASVIRKVFPALSVLEIDPSSTAAEDQEATPERLGDYRIVREIGRGGMGVVYESQQLSLGRSVALKVLPFAAMLDDKQLRRFKNEARAAATLSHPNIVPVYSVGAERGVHFYAMRLIDGQNLAEVIRDLRLLEGRDSDSLTEAASEIASQLRSGRFGSDLEKPLELPTSAAHEDHSTGPPNGVAAETKPVAQGAIPTDRSKSRLSFYRSVAALGVQAAEALAHAHESGVLHRDIKPANLMVDASGNLWVTDFGLARLECDVGMTMTGDLLGTIRYMAPEVSLAKRVVVDQRADVYSLGATLYELVTLEPVFRGTDRQELLRMIAFEEPRAPRKIDAAIPAELETIILKAIEKNPEDRYQSATEFADDLNRFLEHRPILALRVGLLQHVRKWTRRHRAVVTSAILSVLVSVCVAFLFLTQAYRSEREQRLIAEHQKGRAEARLQLSLEAVDDMYVNIATVWIARESSISGVQTAFLEKALRTYRQVGTELANDTSKREAFAHAYERIGQIHEFLDEHQYAAQALRKSIEATEQLILDEPDSSEHLARLVNRYGWLAESLQELADLQHVEQSLNNVERHLQALMDRHPEEDGYQRLWGNYYLQRANLKLNQNQLAQAEQLCRRAVDIFTNIYPLNPTENPNRNDLDACLLVLKSNCCLGEIVQRQGRMVEARSRYERTLRLCDRFRRSLFYDSQSMSVLAGRLEALLAEVARSDGRLTEAEEQLRRSLETQRQAFNSGYDPVLFFLKSFGQESLDKDFEQELFCGYVETQLRLAAALLALGRAYETERVLGECIRTTQMLCDSRPDILRYRIARLNSWARTGQLLAQSRPEESRPAWEYATAIWDDTLMKFSHAGEYRSGIYDSTDYEWYRANLPGTQKSAADSPFVYAQFDDPLRETVFQQHALGLALYRGDAWKSAIHHFGKAAELRKSDQAFDWLYIAMAYRKLGEVEQAREWFDMAITAIRESDSADVELMRLSELAGNMFSDEGISLSNPRIESGDLKAFDQSGQILSVGTASSDIDEPEVLLLRHNQKMGFPGVQAVMVHTAGDLNSNPRFGKIAVAVTIGSQDNASFALWRFLGDRFEPDGSFGDQGVAEANVNASLWGAGMDSSERIMAAGIGSQGELILARFSTDGSLDPGFGDGGQVRTDEQVFDQNNLSIAFDETDDMYVAGVFGGRGGSFRVVKFSSQGAIDHDFGDNGVRTIKLFWGIEFNGSRLNTLPASVAVQQDGKIVISGTVGDPNNRYAVVIRLNRDGSLDGTFAGDRGMPTSYPGKGIVTTNIPYREVVNSRNYGSGIVIDERNRILTTGTSSHGMVVARYNPDGSLDTTFNASGAISTIPGVAVAMSREQHVSGHTRGRHLTLDSLGRIVVGGLYQHGIPKNSFGWPVVGPNTDLDHLVVARFNRDGALDETFGADGVFEKRVGSSWNLTSLVVAPSGDIWAAGVARAPTDDNDVSERDPFGQTRQPYVPIIVRFSNQLISAKSSK